MRLQCRCEAAEGKAVKQFFGEKLQNGRKTAGSERTG